MHRNWRRLITSMLHVLVTTSLLLNSAPAVAQTATPTPDDSRPAEADRPPLLPTLLSPWSDVEDATSYLPLVAKNAPLEPAPEPEPEPEPEVGLSKRVAPRLVGPGAVVTYTLVMTSSERVQDGVLTDRLTGGLELVQADGATYDASARELRWEGLGLAAGAVLTRSLRARLAASILRTSTRTEIENSASFTSESLGQTAVATATLFVGTGTTGVLTPQGGELTSADGRVRVVAPPGAVAETSVVTLTTYPGTELAPNQPGVALNFSLEPDLTFAVPVTLSVDLHGLVACDALEKGLRPYVAYLENPVRDEWQDVPLQRVDLETDVVSATLAHFSDYSAGATSTSADPALWQFTYNPQAVSLYSGAATYNYPIELPPGRGGLQPTVNLSYSSRRVDGLLGADAIDAGPLGLGWSVDQMDVVRRFDSCHDGSTHTCIYDDDFRLLMNGTGYDLEPAGSQYWGRFYAKDAPGLYVERRNFCADHPDPYYAACAGAPRNGSAENESGEYWVVRTPDGTQARL